MARYYFDHAATTPLDPVVLEAMMPFLTTQYGNASSTHSLGRQARFAVEDARERAAAVLNCEPGEIVFTSGGTEADNLAVHGVLTAAGRRGPDLLTSAAEHDAVLRLVDGLRKRGHGVQVLVPGADGRIDPAEVMNALSESTGLVSLMLVNNETGAINPISEVAAVCRLAGVPLHTDAVQAPGAMDVRVDRLGVDLLTLSGHKIYGPKGVGLLYVRAGTALEPVISGGGQERGRRGGTENVAAIVGLAVALERAAERHAEEASRLAHLRERLRQALVARYGERVRVNTPSAEHAVPHILSVSFGPAGEREIDGEMLLLALDMAGVMVSAGSACASGALEPSHVLKALDVPPAFARATVRFSMGRETTVEAVDQAVSAVEAALERQTRR